ncbi:hypothetical protein ACOI1C_04410 [Bacillus sp. DJP31]|uniref:hypothetical protein n=1 Tax=Bacillus sp. DJP31 TaxID=3409789 RepID=UPI003BB5FC68
MRKKGNIRQLNTMEQQVESPLNFVNELAEGNQQITFKGHSDATQLRFGLFESDLPSETLTSPFVNTLLFTDSTPAYSIYRLTATNEACNRVNRNYEFFYPIV